MQGRPGGAGLRAGQAGFGNMIMKSALEGRLRVELERGAGQLVAW